MFLFIVNLGMWPLKSIISEKQALFWGFQHTFMGFLGDRWENMHFESKPRHMTPQINCLGKTSPVLRVSTHIYGVSRKIDGKMFIFNCCHFVIGHLYKYIHLTVYHIFLRYSTAFSQTCFSWKKWLSHVSTAPKIPSSKFSGVLNTMAKVWQLFVTGI